MFTTQPLNYFCTFTQMKTRNIWNIIRILSSRFTYLFNTLQKHIIYRPAPCVYALFANRQWTGSKGWWVKGFVCRYGPTFIRFRVFEQFACFVSKLPWPVCPSSFSSYTETVEGKKLKVFLFSNKVTPFPLRLEGDVLLIVACFYKCMHLVYLILVSLSMEQRFTNLKLLLIILNIQQSQLMGWVGWSALFSLWLNHCSIFIHTLDICENINL